MLPTVASSRLMSFSSEGKEAGCFRKVAGLSIDNAAVSGHFYCRQPSGYIV